MILYRCEAVNYTEDEYIPEIQYREFTVKKETNCGYWIDHQRKRKWVSKSSVKRFAYPTKAQALEALLFRRIRAKAISEAMVYRNDVVIELVKKRLQEAGL